MYKKFIHQIIYPNNHYIITVILSVKIISQISFKFLQHKPIAKTNQLGIMLILTSTAKFFRNLLKPFGTAMIVIMMSAIIVIMMATRIVIMMMVKIFTHLLPPIYNHRSYGWLITFSLIM